MRKNEAGNNHIGRLVFLLSFITLLNHTVRRYLSCPYRLGFHLEEVPVDYNSRQKRNKGGAYQRLIQSNSSGSRDLFPYLKKTRRAVEAVFSPIRNIHLFSLSAFL